MRRGPAPADGEADCDKKKLDQQKSLKFVLIKADLCLQLLQAFSDFFIGPFFFLIAKLACFLIQLIQITIQI